MANSNLRYLVATKYFNYPTSTESSLPPTLLRDFHQKYLLTSHTLCLLQKPGNSDRMAEAAEITIAETKGKVRFIIEET